MTATRTRTRSGWRLSVLLPTTLALVGLNLLMPQNAWATCNGRASTQAVADHPPETGTVGDDVLEGDGGDNTMESLAGDDILCGKGGDDTLRGGADEDMIFGSTGDDDIELGAGAIQ